MKAQLEGTWNATHYKSCEHATTNDDDVGSAQPALAASEPHLASTQTQPITVVESRSIFLNTETPLCVIKVILTIIWKLASRVMLA